MKNRKNILLLSTAFSLVLIAIFISGWKEKPKTGYILISKVYSEFNMKKELESKYKVTSSQRQKILDSLAIELRLIANKLEIEKHHEEKDVALYNYKREEYLQKRKQFEQDNAELTKEYDQEILVQLNQYVKDFGEKYNYEYIFGNDGNGSLMFATETNDISMLVSNFINQKYAGIK